MCTCVNIIKQDSTPCCNQIHWWGFLIIWEFYTYCFEVYVSRCAVIFHLTLKFHPRTSFSKFSIFILIFLYSCQYIFNFVFCQNVALVWIFNNSLFSDVFDGFNFIVYFQFTIRKNLIFIYYNGESKCVVNLNHKNHCIKDENFKQSHLNSVCLYIFGSEVLYTLHPNSLP